MPFVPSPPGCDTKNVSRYHLSGGAKLHPLQNHWVKWRMSWLSANSDVSKLRPAWWTSQPICEEVKVRVGTWIPETTTSDVCLSSNSYTVECLDFVSWLPVHFHHASQRLFHFPGTLVLLYSTRSVFILPEAKVWTECLKGCIDFSFLTKSSVITNF